MYSSKHFPKTSTPYPAPQQHPESPPLVPFTKPLPHFFTRFSQDASALRDLRGTLLNPRLPSSYLRTSVLPVAPTPASSQRAPSLSFSLTHSFSLFISHAVNLFRGPVCYILSQGAERERETIKVSNPRPCASNDKRVDRQCETITM